MFCSSQNLDKQANLFYIPNSIKWRRNCTSYNLVAEWHIFFLSFQSIIPKKIKKLRATFGFSFNFTHLTVWWLKSLQISIQKQYAAGKVSIQLNPEICVFLMLKISLDPKFNFSGEQRKKMLNLTYFLKAIKAVRHVYYFAVFFFFG